MTDYSANWLMCIIVAVIFHIAAVSGFFYVLPYFAPAPKLENVAEMEWIDVDLTDDAPLIVDDEAIPSDTPTHETTFDADDLTLPELKIPEPIIEPVKPAPPEINPAEPLKPQSPTPKPADDKQDVQPKPPPAQVPDKETPADNRQVVTRPPITINAVYPQKGSVLGFKGYISFAAHIDKNGKVTATEILQSSGRYFVDEIARKAAEQWTFKPALDQRGRPMECDKIITFDFTKFS